MIDVNRLRVFRAVVAAGSVASASRSLGYTSSAVSQHLTALQRETGLTLFEKDGRGIRPTAAARQLASQSEELMASLGRLDTVVDDLRSGRSGSMSIGTFASAGEHWLPSVTATLAAEFPDTRWSVVLTDPLTVRTRPDIDIVTEDPNGAPGERAGFVRIELMVEPYVALLRHDHPLAGRSEINAADLADERWIRDDNAETACSRITGNAWRAAGFTPKSIIQAADHHGAAKFVQAGLGVCVMPRLAAADLPPDVVRLSVVNPTPRRRVVLQVRESIAAHPAGTRAIELLQHAATVPTTTVG